MHVQFALVALHTLKLYARHAGNHFKPPSNKIFVPVRFQGLYHIGIGKFLRSIRRKRIKCRNKIHSVTLDLFVRDIAFHSAGHKIKDAVKTMAVLHTSLSWITQTLKPAVIKRPVCNPVFLLLARCQKLSVFFKSLGTCHTKWVVSTTTTFKLHQNFRREDLAQSLVTNEVLGEFTESPKIAIVEFPSLDAGTHADSLLRFHILAQWLGTGLGQPEGVVDAVTLQLLHTARTTFAVLGRVKHQVVKQCYELLQQTNVMAVKSHRGTHDVVQVQSMAAAYYQIWHWNECQTETSKRSMIKWSQEPIPQHLDLLRPNIVKVDGKCIQHPCVLVGTTVADVGDGGGERKVAMLQPTVGFPVSLQDDLVRIAIGCIGAISLLRPLLGSRRFIEHDGVVGELVLAVVVRQSVVAFVCPLAVGVAHPFLERLKVRLTVHGAFEDFTNEVTQVNPADIEVMLGVDKPTLCSVLCQLCAVDGGWVNRLQTKFRYVLSGEVVHVLHTRDIFGFTPGCEPPLSAPIGGRMLSLCFIFHFLPPAAKTLFSAGSAPPLSAHPSGGVCYHYVLFSTFGAKIRFFLDISK